MALLTSKAVATTDDAASGAVAAAASAPGALVLGGDYRGLALVRNLGRLGIPVWVITQPEYRLAGLSRYAQRTLRHPGWESDGGVQYLLDAGRKYGLRGWLLFPTADDSAYLVSSNYRELAECFQPTVPPWEVLRWVVDKRLLNELAARIGVAYPRTFAPRDRAHLLAADFNFPVILKPASRERVNRLTMVKAWRANDRRTLLAKYDAACRLLPPERLMIQEIIPGGGEAQFSYAAVCAGGRPLISMVARRARQIPMDFGRASTLVETIDDPGIVEPSVRLLREIHYSGMVEIEFKRDPRGGEFKLLDVNPRVWGWYSLCERAGVDFGGALWRMYRGEAVPEMRATPGIRWMRLTTDAAVCARELLRGRLSVGDYARSLLGPRAAATFARDDPWPGIAEMPLLLSLFCRRVARRGWV